MTSEADSKCLYFIAFCCNFHKDVSIQESEAEETKSTCQRDRTEQKA